MSNAYIASIHSLKEKTFLKKDLAICIPICATLQDFHTHQGTLRIRPTLNRIASHCVASITLSNLEHTIIITTIVNNNNNKTTPTSATDQCYSCMNKYTNKLEAHG